MEEPELQPYSTILIVMSWNPALPIVSITTNTIPGSLHNTYHEELGQRIVQWSIAETCEECTNAADYHISICCQWMLHQRMTSTICLMKSKKNECQNSTTQYAKNKWMCPWMGVATTICGRVCATPHPYEPSKNKVVRPTSIGLRPNTSASLAAEYIWVKIVFEWRHSCLPYQ